jgi:hypothetical protein
VEWKERTAKLCMAVRESGEWSVVQENENENEKYCPFFTVRNITLRLCSKLPDSILILSSHPVRQRSESKGISSNS